MRPPAPAPARRRLGGLVSSAAPPAPPRATAPAATGPRCASRARRSRRAAANERVRAPPVTCPRLSPAPLPRQLLPRRSRTRQLVAKPPRPLTHAGAACSVFSGRSRVRCRRHRAPAVVAGVAEHRSTASSPSAGRLSSRSPLSLTHRDRSPSTGSGLRPGRPTLPAQRCAGWGSCVSRPVV